MQLVLTFKELKPRGDLWKGFSSLIIFSKVRFLVHLDLMFRLSISFHFITFKQGPQEDPSNLMKNGVKSPYIIAVISAANKIGKYYIPVNGILISVSYLFKWHFQTIKIQLHFLINFRFQRNLTLSRRWISGIRFIKFSKLSLILL